MDRSARMLRTGARFLMKKRRNFEDAPRLRTGAQIYSKSSGCSARERDFEQQKDEILRMLRMGARLFSKCSGCSTRERDFIQNFEDAPQGGAILFKISRMLRTGARCFSKFSGCSARERDFLLNFQDAPHGSAILNDGVVKPIPKLYRSAPLF